MISSGQKLLGGFPVDRENLLRLANELREEMGPDAVAKLVLASIAEGSLYVIDGVRNLEEVNAFKSKANVILIAVHASPKERFRRLLSRGREDDPKTIKNFLRETSRNLS